MGLEMREHCELCRTALGAGAEAYICSHECTFCAACAGARGMICPNCDGELLRRPRRVSAPAR